MEGPTAPMIYRAAMPEDPKDSQSADEDWIEELVRRLNEALIAGGRIIAVEFEAIQRTEAKDRMDRAKAALLVDIENSDGTDTARREELVNELQRATEDFMGDESKGR
jgi:hypothetical protein